uniref:Uncharacterized protein n=1 Tax=viral metagenome TaxID=1070528 RepID=A0A6M3IFN1_9ZZZZ
MESETETRIHYEVTKVLTKEEYELHNRGKSIFMTIEKKTYLIFTELDGMANSIICPDCGNPGKFNVSGVLVGNKSLFGVIRCGNCLSLLTCNFTEETKKELIRDLEIERNLIDEHWGEGFEENLKLQ